MIYQKQNKYFQYFNFHAKNTLSDCSCNFWTRFWKNLSQVRKKVFKLNSKRPTLKVSSSKFRMSKRDHSEWDTEAAVQSVLRKRCSENTQLVLQLY